MKLARYDEHTVFPEDLPALYITRTVTAERYTPEPNWHEDVEIQFMLEGEGRFLADFCSHNVRKGCIAVANSEVIHHTVTETSLFYSCIIIDVRFCRQMGIDTSALEFDTLFQSEKLFELHNEFYRVYTDGSNPCRTAILYRIILEILITLRQNHTVCARRSVSDDKSITLVKKAIRHIRENYTRKLTLDALSKVAATNKYTLSREFKRITGLTVVQYINTFRCKVAAELISHGSAVYEAALACGFMSLSLFTKTFSKCMGKLPSELKGGKEQT